MILTALKILAVIMALPILTIFVVPLYKAAFDLLQETFGGDDE